MLETAVEPISIDPPFAIPRPIIRQAWWQLTFLHWSFPLAAVRPLVPNELELDLWDGRIYVGLLLDDITHPALPALPWLSRFAETNVRTYVYDRHGRRGVWFFSLDAARLAAVVGARASYALPYHWARMSVRKENGTVQYRSHRRYGAPAITDIAVTPGPGIDAPSPLETFLTARWSLFAHRRGRLLRAEVDHPRWPLQYARLERCDESLFRAAGLPAPAGEPHVLYSAGVRVMTGWPRTV